jgi:hypothetical protein
MTGGTKHHNAKRLTDNWRSDSRVALTIPYRPYHLNLFYKKFCLVFTGGRLQNFAFQEARPPGDAARFLSLSTQLLGSDTSFVLGSQDGCYGSPRYSPSLCMRMCKLQSAHKQGFEFVHPPKGSSPYFRAAEVFSGANAISLSSLVAKTTEYATTQEFALCLGRCVA